MVFPAGELLCCCDNCFWNSTFVLIPYTMVVHQWLWDPSSILPDADNTVMVWCFWTTTFICKWTSCSVLKELKYLRLCVYNKSQTQPTNTLFPFFFLFFFFLPFKTKQQFIPLSPSSAVGWDGQARSPFPLPQPAGPSPEMRCQMVTRWYFGEAAAAGSGESIIF
jgi:hypothetical protein